METLSNKVFDVRDILVACTNADPFNVADNNAYDYVQGIIDNADQGEVQVLTQLDDEYWDWAWRLGYTDSEMPIRIYLVNGNELAFTCSDDGTIIESPVYRILKTRDGQAPKVYDAGLTMAGARHILQELILHCNDLCEPNEGIFCEADARALIEFCDDDPKVVAKLEDIIRTGEYGVYTNVNEGCDLLYKCGDNSMRYDVWTYTIERQ